MSRSADEGNGLGFDYGKGRGRSVRRGHSNNLGNYFKNELNNYRPRSTSPINHPSYPKYNNDTWQEWGCYSSAENPSRSYKYSECDDFQEYEKDDNLFPRRRDNLNTNNSRYMNNAVSLDEAAHQWKDEYHQGNIFPTPQSPPTRRSNLTRKSHYKYQKWRYSSQDWRGSSSSKNRESFREPGEETFGLRELRSNVNDTESGDTFDSSEQEEKKWNKWSGLKRQQKKKPKRRSGSGGKEMNKDGDDKEKDLRDVSSTPSLLPSFSSVTKMPLLDDVQQIQLAWLQHMGAGATVMPGMPFTSPVPGMLPVSAGFGGACTGCHLTGMNEIFRQLSQAAALTTSNFIPAVPSNQPQPTSSQALLAMLQPKDTSPSQGTMLCSACGTTTPCHCPHQDNNQVKPLDGMLDSTSKLCNATQSHNDGTLLRQGFQSPHRHGMGVAGIHPSPLHRIGATIQSSSPLHTFLAQLNDSALSSMSSIQMHTPDRHKDENLPPIGVFWDIENCSVPTGKSAFALVQKIRDRFFEGHREAEFMCVCDISKESSSVIQELNDAQVTVAHINAVAKNAADDKIKQSLRRFADTHSRPATVVLISGDMNFARDLSDLRHRNGLRVILVHRNHTSEALISCANEAIEYVDLLEDLPFRSPSKVITDSSQLVVHNLPGKRHPNQVRSRLEQLSYNCGGKVVHQSVYNAVIKFPNNDSAVRAKKRMEGEDVFGNKISIAFPKQRTNFNSPKTNLSQNSSVLEDSRRTSDIEAGYRSSNGDGYRDSPRRRGGSNRRRDDRAFSDNDYRYDEKPFTNNNSSKRNDLHNFSPQFNVKPFNQQQLLSNPDSSFKPLGYDDTSSAKQTDFTKPADFTSYFRHALNLESDKWENAEQSKVLGAEGGGRFRTAPNIQRLTPPCHPMSSLADGGISPLPLRGAYNIPIPTSPLPLPTQSKGQWEPPAGVDLLVTNLDNQMTRKELKRFLSAAIAEYAKVLHMKLFAPSQGNFQAIVRVPSLPDALRTLLKVNHTEIGAWKIDISLVPVGDSNMDKLRLMAIPVLQEYGRHNMPLTEFKKAFQQRYHQMVYTHDLYQITDVVTLRDMHVGKTISLSTYSRPGTPNTTGFMSSSSRQSPMNFVPTRDPTPLPCPMVCDIHIKTDTDSHPISAIDLCIYISLRTFISQVRTLLDMHNGAISLHSLPSCYSTEFSNFMRDPLYGVPLEHLLTAIHGVQVTTGHEGFKVVCWNQRKLKGDDDGSKTTPLLPTPLFYFSRDVMDLLKHSPLCKLDYHKFATEYHHRNGKQCRVADYGFLKLSELFEAISHCVQILGEDDKKIITLTHKTQMKRFNQDLLKVLKSLASKQVTLKEFPVAFYRMFGRQFVPAEYGLCELHDLLDNLPEGFIEVSEAGGDTIIFIPKREQTAEEVYRMKTFAREIVDVLSRVPHHSITFTKFIPTYHHHFGRQCRVSDYGFNKLIELFEALSDVVKVSENGPEKYVTLSDPERLAALCWMIKEFLPQSKEQAITTNSIAHNFMKRYGYCPVWQDLGLRSFKHLISLFPHVMEVFQEDGVDKVYLMDHLHMSILTQHVLVILLKAPNGCLSLKDFVVSYADTWQQVLEPAQYGYSQLWLLLKALPHIAVVQDDWNGDFKVELTPAYHFARSASMVLLQTPQNALSLDQFSQKYHHVIGKELIPSEYEHPSITALISAVPWVLSLVGKGTKCFVSLNELCIGPTAKRKSQSPRMVGQIKILPRPPEDSAILEVGRISSILPKPPSRKSSEESSASSDLMKVSPKHVSPTELLCEKSPSNIPSPALQPYNAPLQSRDLITFDSPRLTPDPTCIELAAASSSYFLETGLSSSSALFQDKDLSMSLPSSTTRSLSQRDDFADISSLPSSALSSPSRMPPRSRSRSQVKLAANFATTLPR